VQPAFNGTSSLIKNEGRFYLVMEYGPKALKNNYITTMLCEYGQKHASAPVTEYFLREHGEILIDEFAVSKLSSM